MLVLPSTWRDFAQGPSWLRRVTSKQHSELFFHIFEFVHALHSVCHSEKYSPVFKAERKFSVMIRIWRMNASRSLGQENYAREHMSMRRRHTSIVE